jgi:prepilin-type N-terminal cleavage/methylation domain-containing protein
MRSHIVRGNGPPGGRRAARGFTLLESLIAVALSALLLTSLFSLYYGAARGAATNASRTSENREARMINHRLSRDFKLVGLLAPQDCNGDSDDVNRDVPGELWSDSLRQDFEFANTYDIAFTGDVDNDGVTETVRYVLDPVNSRLFQYTWEWSRDSVAWSPPVMKRVANYVDHILFNFFDRDGNPIPNPVQYPTGGYTLSAGERLRVTTVEILIVTRSERAESGYAQYVYTPDGHYWYDGYHRVVQRFMVRGRNLSLGA